MSNIQITENGPGKYSPEWFYSESQTPEWISFAHKADELRENFINLFGIERLKSLSGKDLLTSLQRIKNRRIYKCLIQIKHGFVNNLELKMQNK